MNKYIKYLIETSISNEQLEQRLSSIDYYTTLGINNNASSSEIYESFKELMDEFKPTFTLNKNLETNAIVTTHILEAFTMLSNQVKRDKYDKELTSNKPNPSIKFIELEDGSLEIEDEYILNYLTSLLKTVYLSKDQCDSEEAKEKFIYLTQKINQLKLASHITLNLPKLPETIDNNKAQDENYKLFQEDYQHEVLAPTEDFSEKKYFLQILKENILKSKSIQPKDIFTIIMTTLVSVILVAGFYVEIEKFKEQWKSIDFNQVSINIQTMLDQYNEKTELIINHDVTAEDTKKSLSKYSGISYKSFEDINEFDEGDAISFIYTVSNRNLKKCGTTKVIDENECQNIKEFCEKYNTNIETLASLNPELNWEIDEYFISHLGMYRFSDAIDSIKVPDIESIKNYDVENSVVYQKIKKEV